MKVFISYNHRDKFVARIFDQWVKESGLSPIRDDVKFEPREISNEIIDKIRECDLFLAILSSSFYKSQWTRDEVGQARALEKPILFVAIEEGCIPQGPDRLKRPLELWRKETETWRNELIAAINNFLRGKIPNSVGLDQWFSQYVGSNEWVQERVRLENIAHTHLNVASCVELASKWAGWESGEVKSRDSGEFQPEPEVGNLMIGKAVNLSEKENYALRSFREDLTDEPWLDLNLQQISHELVRLVGDNFDKIDNKKYKLFESGCLHFPNSVVVHLVLITSDNYLVVGHRSSRPRFYENCWSVTYEEHMRVSKDGTDIFQTAIRGLKEELVGENKFITTSQVHFFSLFREIDHWRNDERDEAFWDINIGLSGLIKVPFPVETIFNNWLQFAEDKREFRHLVAIPYSFDNVLMLARNEPFDPTVFGSTILLPTGTDRNFPDLSGKPKWRRQHPTNAIRLIRCLTYDFRRSLESKVGLQL
jgi:hypothetical protein